MPCGCVLSVSIILVVTDRELGHIVQDNLNQLNISRTKELFVD